MKLGTTSLSQYLDLEQFDSLNTTRFMIKKCLENFYLPDEVKDRILRSLKPNQYGMAAIEFVDNALIEAFHCIPKPQRVLFNYLICHFSRYKYKFSFF